MSVPELGGLILGVDDDAVVDEEDDVGFGVAGDVADGDAARLAGGAALAEAVAFDGNGYRYHARVKALADAARKAGFKF